MHMLTKENGGRDPGLGYLRKEEEDFLVQYPRKGLQEE